MYFYVCMYACVYVYMCVCVYELIYIYICDVWMMASIMCRMYVCNGDDVCSKAQVCTSSEPDNAQVQLVTSNDNRDIVVFGM